MGIFTGRAAAKKRDASAVAGWLVGGDGCGMQVPGYTRLIDCPEVAAAVDAITLATRQENAAGARRLGAIGDLWALRAPDDDIEKRYWAIDGYAGLVVEVAAALGVSRKRAQAQVDRAVMLRTRLPKVAAIYAKGLIDAVMVAMIVARTDLIIDDDVAVTAETATQEAPPCPRRQLGLCTAAVKACGPGSRTGSPVS